MEARTLEAGINKLLEHHHFFSSLSSSATATDYHPPSLRSPRSMSSSNMLADTSPRIDKATDALTAGQKRKRDTEDDPNPWVGLTKVLVGPEKEPFFVHTRVLRSAPFFRGCLDANMIDSAEGVVRLPKDDPRAFACIVHWLYHKTLPSKVLPEKILASMNSELTENTRTWGKEISSDIYLLVRTYVLCQRLLMEELQNYLMDAFRVLQDKLTMDHNMFREVCDNVAQEDSLRKLLMYQLNRNILQLGGFTAWKKNSELYSHFAALNQGNMEMVAEALGNPSREKEPWKKGEPCDWHVHIDTPKCRGPTNYDDLRKALRLPQDSSSQ